MKQNDTYTDGILLWCFVKEFRHEKNYPLSNLLEIDFVKKWWDQQNSHIQTINLPYWRKALWKRSNTLFRRLTQDARSKLSENYK